MAIAFFLTDFIVVVIEKRALEWMNGRVKDIQTDAISGMILWN